MSTVAHHLLMLDYYRRNSHEREFASEAYLLASSHLAELMFLQTDAAIAEARDSVQALLDKYGLPNPQQIAPETKENET